MLKSILVVCIGNICRSPMGEALLKAQLQNTAPDVLVSSAGLNALVGYKADSMAEELMKLRGLDISNHRARQVTAEIIFQSELILTMSTEQQEMMEQQFPSVRGRVHRFGKWGEYNIPDPYRRPRAVFEQALTLIDQGVNDWCRKLWI